MSEPRRSTSPLLHHAQLIWLGRRPYQPLHHLQQTLHEARRHDRIGNIILLLEHDPVITLGRGANPLHILLDPAALQQQGVEVVATGRGGDVTYHGPGQLVAYPILDLKPDRCDVRKYVRALAEVMILLARHHHVEAGVVDGLVGVWVDRAAPDEWAGAPWARDLAKIGAIGVKISRWVTMHGFAFNVAVDLNAFRWIVPCGIRDHGVTSLNQLTPHSLDLRSIALSTAPFFEQALGIKIDSSHDLSSQTDLLSTLTR